MSGCLRAQRLLCGVLLTLLGLSMGCRARTVIDSVPRGARVHIAGEDVGVTPVALDVESHHLLGPRPRVRIARPGFQTRVGTLAVRYDRRSLWLTPLALTLWGIPLVVHPAMTTRVQDYYRIVLDEDLGEAYEPRLEIFRGETFPGDAQQRQARRRAVLLGERLP